MKKTPHPQPLSEREGTNGKWRAYSYDESIKRDKASLDIFWLKDERLSESENLPSPDVIAREIAEDLEAALGQIQEILSDLGPQPRQRTF